MPSDPYKAPATEIIAQPDPLRMPSIIIAVCTLAILIVACWCFYVSNALNVLTARDSTSIEQIEQLARQIESEELTPRRDTLLEYFRLNRSFLIEDVRYQRSAQVNFIVVGVLLICVFTLQMFIAIQLRRRAAEAAKQARH